MTINFSHIVYNEKKSDLDIEVLKKIIDKQKY